MKADLKCGDCIVGMKSLAPASVDVVVTSPPYNLGINYSAYHDKLAGDEYIFWCYDWAKKIKRVLKPDGSFFLNIGGDLAMHVACELQCLFQLQNTIHWIKAISIENGKGTNSYGHFKPINSTRYLNDLHEFVFHFTHHGTTKLDRLAVGVPYADKSNIARWSHTNGKDKRCRGNTWFIPYKTIQQRAKQRPHPATFPTELAVKCIRLHGRKDCTVLDPFLGIGHAALGAKESGLVSQFYGFDIDAEYIKIALEALAL